MSMILFVLHDPEKLQDLLNAWEQIGVNGVTVFQSTGIGRIRQEQGLRDDMPIIPSLASFLPSPERMGQTIFTVLKDESLVPELVAATEHIVGNLNEPNTGLLVVLPTTQVYGLEKNKP